MPKKTIVVAQNLNDDLTEKITSLVPGWNVIIGRDPEIWRDYIREAEIIGCWRKPMGDMIEENRNLKWVQSWSAGVNSLPLEHFKKENVIVTSASGVHAYPISETIFAFMLSLTRKIHTYVRNQQDKIWDRSPNDLEMHGKTLGIIGVGKIGKETARIAKAFRMNVLGVRKSGEPEEFVDEMFTMDELEKVLPHCDYVVISVPLTKLTRKMFGKKQFEQMKSTAYFVNIGRGEVVDEQALIEALQTKQIAGAGLDVFEHEPLPAESPLWEMDEVIVSPHTSGSTAHYAERVVEDIFLPNLQAYIDGRNPEVNVVNFTKGY